MGVTNSNKQVSTGRILCGGMLNVTLALAASPDIVSNPTDIVLVLDRSGSMAGSPLANMKVGAKTFIDIIDEATDGAADGQIGSGSRIGIVSFSDSATADTQLITSVADLKDAVDGLTAGGSTNHADAFATAMGLFDPLSTNAKVIVMFTDGKTTAGPPPSPVAAAARASGIIIYAIGLIGSDGIDVSVLNDWATDPDASHVAVTPDDDDLEELFEDLAANISKTGATDIVIDEVLTPGFTILDLPAPTKGTVEQTGAGSLRWKIDELGVFANEGASLTFTVRHTGQDAGEKLVNQSVTYTDNEGNAVTFPAPKVQVDCEIVVHPEPCPDPVELEIEGCQDAVVADAGDVRLLSSGRILQLDVTVKQVCPGKRVALAAILTEVDAGGSEYQRGMKAVTLPAHIYTGCRDILVRCLPFVLPDDLEIAGAAPPSLCRERKFKVRLIANYVDTDYRCCDSVIAMP